MSATEAEEIKVWNTSKALAVLIAEQKSYSYVDKLGYATSRDLVLFYLKEALRDLHSLKNKEFENKRAEEEFKSIRFDYLDKEIEDISKIESKQKLREITSLIASKALALSMNLSV
ncbi:MAG: type I-A CRISPR-associated protein Csa5 [Thermoproteota archaeon]|jgi:CRISPR-associated protein Csa5